MLALFVFLCDDCLTGFTSQADNLTDVSETIANAKGFCPFSPHHNSTGIITSQRDYISATSVDSAERNPVIYRIYTNNKEKVRTQQNSKWLNGTGYPPISKLKNHRILQYVQSGITQIHKQLSLQQIMLYTKRDNSNSLKDIYISFFRT